MSKLHISTLNGAKDGQQIGPTCERGAILGALAQFYEILLQIHRFRTKFVTSLKCRKDAHSVVGAL